MLLYHTSYSSCRKTYFKATLNLHHTPSCLSYKRKKEKGKAFIHIACRTGKFRNYVTPEEAAAPIYRFFIIR